MRASTACSSSASRRPTSTAGRSVPRRRPRRPTAASSPRRRRPSRPASGPACAAGRSWRQAARRWTTRSASRSSSCSVSRKGTSTRRRDSRRSPDQFELSSRQIRRIVQKELGVPPIQLLLTRRLLLAKQLLTETALPITEVAFASGFSSLRRFNDAFNRRYGMPPTRLRKKATDGARRDRRAPDVDAAAVLPAAVRLERHPRVSGRPRAQRHRARDGHARMRARCSWERPRAGSG